MEATAQAIDSLRSAYSEEDFAVIADDMMYYRAMAYEYLEQQGLSVTRTEGRQPVGFIVDGQAKTFDFEIPESADLLVLYEPGKAPAAVAPTDLDRVAEYFGFRRE